MISLVNDWVWGVKLREVPRKDSQTSNIKLCLTPDSLLLIMQPVDW